MIRMCSRIALNTVFQLVARGVEILSGIWVNVWIARGWGSQLFGQIGFFSSLIGICSFLFSFGSEVLLVRLISRDKEKARHYLMHALCLIGPTSLLGAGIAIVLGVSLTSPAYLAVIALACLQCFFSTVALLLQACFYAYERMEWDTLLSLTDRLCWVGLGLWLAFHPPSLLGMFAALALCKGLKLLLGIGIFLRFLLPQTLPAKLDGGEIRRLFLQSWPFGLELLFSTVYASVDVLLLARWVGEGEAGYYRAAAMLISPLVILAVSFNNAFYPRLSVLAVTHPEELPRYGKLSGHLLVLVSVPLTVFFLSFAESIVRFVFGPRFIPAVPLLQLLSLVLPLRFLNNSLTTVLWASDRQTAQMTCEGIAAGFSLLANVCLISRFGAVGACWAVLGTDLLRLGILWGCLRRSLGAIEGRSFWSPVLATGILLVCRGLCLPWGAAGLALLLFYPPLLLGFRILGWDDVRWLQESGPPLVQIDGNP